jgi:acetoin utilization deacetylase AcuC-like enzyme
MKIVFSKECLEYDSPGHPESSERVRKTYGFLKNFKKFEFVKPEECERKELLLVHSEKMIDRIKHSNFVNFETPPIPNIYRYAKLAVGGSILSMETALKEGKSFSLMRPPGHHAGKANFEGFCYFNNLAIAVTKALKKIERAGILDIDCHHGQGSQEIFLGNTKVVYASLHQYGFFYPGTGKYSEGNCYNYPLDSGTGEEAYLDKLEIALEKIKKFGPDLIAVSAGFDTYEEDPLANLKLGIGTYAKISKMISELGKPGFAVLEGGYSEKLPECVYSFLKNF